MKFLMRKCLNCGRYTFKDTCPVCSHETVVPHPPRFSPEDKYVKYRVMAKLAMLKASGDLTTERPSTSEGKQGS